MPIRRLPVIDTVSQWNNTSADLIVKQFGTECRTSLGSDEDTLTLAHEASHNCMDNARADPSDVDAVFFGTVTAPELLLQDEDFTSRLDEADNKKATGNTPMASNELLRLGLNQRPSD